MESRHATCTGLRRLLGLALVVAAVQALAEVPRPPVFSLGLPGLAQIPPSTLLVAVSLNNVSADPVRDVRVDEVRLEDLDTTSSVPIVIGDLAAGASAPVDSSFDASTLAAGHSYRLVLRGTYRTERRSDDDDQHGATNRHEEEGRDGDHGGDRDQGEEGRHDEERDHGHRHRFRLRGVVLLPPVSPGSADLGTVSVPSHFVSGAGFPNQPLEFDADVNGQAPLVPQGPFVALPHGPAGSTAPMKAPLGDPGSIVFTVNAPMGLTSGGFNGTASSTAEPSGGVGGGVVFVTTNWTVDYSTNGGASFTQLNPTNIFPSDAVGYCCDQIVQYVASIDRFVWLLQGTGYRLAVARPADVISSGATAWTYWNLTPQVFGEAAGVSFDYPDLSVGNNDLYISWDGNGGFQVARTSLAGLQAGGTIEIDYTHPGDSPSGVVWGAHLTQDTGNEIFWAGHDGTTQLRVYSLAEGSNTYFWRDVGISSWATNNPMSFTPDNQDWLAKNFNGPGGNTFPRNGVIGATRSGNQLWFAWSAGTDNNFPQAHIEIVTLDRGNNFNPIQQVQVWNPSYAFAYPALATNICTGEVGMSFEFGGGGNYENHVVGFWGDFIAWITTGSSVGTTRFGDYATIRQAGATAANPGNLFDAFGYGLNAPGPNQTGPQTDAHYVQFGRPSSSCVTLQ